MKSVFGIELFKSAVPRFLGGLGENLENMGTAVAGSIIAYCYNAIIS